MSYVVDHFLVIYPVEKVLRRRSMPPHNPSAVWHRKLWLLAEFFTRFLNEQSRCCFAAPDFAPHAA
jgi:hypothetical protein